MAQPTPTTHALPLIPVQTGFEGSQLSLGEQGGMLGDPWRGTPAR